MSMVINTNVQATRTHGVYNRNTSAMNNAMTRVATAQKINSAKDGASVYAISERMRDQIRANDQANQNTQNDSALLKTAQGGIGNTISILNTLKERAINAANDSNLNLNRGDIATEVRELVAQIDDNANKVKFNGRTLLNGAVDNTVGTLNAAATASIADKGSTTIANTKQTATHAVYNLTGMQTLKSDGTLENAAGAKNVVDLSDTAQKALFHSGDKITLTWKEDGALVKKEVDIASNTTITQLATNLSGGSLTFSFQATDSAKLTSGDSDTYDQKVLSASDFSELTVANAGGVGLYAIGNKDVSITDMTISVTSKSPTDGSTITNVDAQEYLSGIKNVQRSFGANDVGSNAVYTSELFVGESAKGIAYGSGNSTKLGDMIIKDGSTKVFPDAVSVGISVNGGTEFKIDAKSTIDDLNTELSKRGYNVRAYLLQAGDTVTYEGNSVTRGSGENQTTLKAVANALYFVGDENTNIDSIALKGYKAGETPVTTTADTIGTMASLQTRGTGSSSAEQSSPLTFFVGGEPNFGIDVTISKMTAESLLGSNAENFASKFLTKEGAQSALTTIDTALNKALNEQTKLGAMEARLGYTSDNLATMNENLEASDSVMRDADLAKEMTNYMKYSVLSQAAQYMLAQSGQNAFSVLNLLQQ